VSFLRGWLGNAFPFLVSNVIQILLRLFEGLKKLLEHLGRHMTLLDKNSGTCANAIAIDQDYRMACDDMWSNRVTT
jgi:hypothetical protein